MKKMLKRWQVLGRSAAVKVAIALTLVLSLMAVPLPGSMGWARGEAEAAPPAQEPPGQLKRRGLAGNISFTTSATSTISTTLAVTSTFGDVQALITEDTIIHSPLQQDMTLEDLADLGDQRIAILFAKGPINEDGTRTVLRIMVIPDKAARTHSRGVVKAKKGGDVGEFEVEGDDGEIIELNDDAGDGGIEEGDDVILVTQTVTDFDGDADGRGKPRKIARGLQKASKIMARLERITDRLAALGDSPKAEKLKARVEKFKARHLERFNEINARFSGDGSGSDSDEGSQNRGRNKGRPVDVGSTGFGPSDDGDDDGKHNRGQKRGRPSDLHPEGGDDNDPDDSDGGDNEDRGKRKARNTGNRGGNN